ncbi:hypothetical protein ALC62_01006 [Cyphomyrmex costatus]|uniref:Copia protein n=1 Tax=Cyphomyrmex costatus TaxID=456900 RepID=A0A151IPQ8_9HYME|nr:hypothetical protein ALC62_01006 [Cyphomyrmex costatus]
MQWKFQVRTILDARDALELIDGSLVKPEGENLTNAVELNRWKRANKVAKEILVTTLDKKPLSLLMSCETAREMWVKLLNIYEQKSADSVYLLQTQFREYRYNPGDDIATHINSMLITTVLNTLPSAFRHFHSAWDSTPAAERTMDKLLSRLMVEETRLGISDMSLNAESALITKKKSRGKFAKEGTVRQAYKRDKDNDFKVSLKCWTCGGPHLRRNCPSRKKDENNQD